LSAVVVDDDEVFVVFLGFGDLVDVAASVPCFGAAAADDPGDASDGEDGSACAIPCPETTAAPVPNVISNPANRFIDPPPPRARVARPSKVFGIFDN
jgi:hypothetical protein